jgi:cytochrome c-type biogenesis protein CcmH/NrfF
MHGALRASAALLMVLFAGSIAAEEPAQSPALPDSAPRWVYDLPHELMSPFCPGRTLADCPSPDAASLRMWIAVQAAAGRSRADVEQELYARYGEVIRGAPKREGIGLAAYWIPAAVFVTGGVLVGWFLHRATQRGRDRAQTPSRGLDPDVERKLDELLRRDAEDDAEDERR